MLVSYFSSLTETSDPVSDKTTEKQCEAGGDRHIMCCPVYPGTGIIITISVS